MDGVQLGKKVRRRVGKSVRVEARKILLLDQVSEKAPNLAADVLGVAERASALRDPHGSRRPGPGVHVLEQVPMNGAQVTGVEFAGWQRLGEPLRGRLF